MMELCTPPAHAPARRRWWTLVLCVCVAFLWVACQNPIWLEGTPCTPDSDCSSPRLQCVQGICTRGEASPETPRPEGADAALPEGSQEPTEPQENTDSTEHPEEPVGAPENTGEQATGTEPTTENTAPTEKTRDGQSTPPEATGPG